MVRPFLAFAVSLFATLCACAASQRPAPAHATEPHISLEARSELIPRVAFASGSALPGDNARRAIDANARWMQAHPRDVLIVTGHCDERGGTAFNLELGDRRARAAALALMRGGITASRLILLSRGKGEPIDLHHNPEAWSRNRRVEFSLR